MYTGAQIKFGDLTPYLTYGLWHTFNTGDWRLRQSTFFCLLISTDILCLTGFLSLKIKGKVFNKCAGTGLNFSFVINNANPNGAENHFASISDEKRTKNYYCTSYLYFNFKNQYISFLKMFCTVSPYISLFPVTLGYICLIL